MFLLVAILFLASLSGGAAGTAAALYLAHLGNPLYLGLQHAIGWGVSALALLTGYLLDRVDRKQALAFGLLAGSLVRFLLGISLGALGPWAFLGLYLASNVLELLLEVRVLVPRLVPHEREKVHGRLSTASLLADLLGAPLGAFLFGQHPSWPFLLGGALTLLALPLAGRLPPLPPRGQAPPGVLAGLRWLFQEAFFRRLAGLVFGASFLRVMPFALLPLWALEAGYGPLGYGLLSAAFSLGGALGGLFAAGLKGRKPHRVLGLLFLLDALALLTLLLKPPLPLGLLLVALLGTSAILVGVEEVVLRQALAPDALLGRVGGGMRFLTGLAGLLGALSAGGVGGRVGPEGVFLGAGLGFLLLALAARTLLGRAP
ncbi:arabinose ABC transporter permease [Thermus composti]|uniref:MFS transporter n=1 Tax=Thermus composti TaxID=532059 RepID=A0ABV6Q254_9DEIN|nr:MFS transporter [Thermus composti]GGN02624.1 arabinose ABC transporter permease [Thermus composti]